MQLTVNNTSVVGTLELEKAKQGTARGRWHKSRDEILRARERARTERKGTEQRILVFIFMQRSGKDYFENEMNWNFPVAVIT